MKIDVYADVVCPWCFIGKRRLERARFGSLAGRGSVAPAGMSARSGKSRFAQGLVERWSGPLLFVATGEARDQEMRERIAHLAKPYPKRERAKQAMTGHPPAQRQGGTDPHAPTTLCLS